MNFALFRNATYTGATISNFLLNGVAGMLLVSMMLVQLGGGLSAQEAGMLTLGYAIAIVAFIRVGEKLLQRFAARKPMIWGSLIVGLSIKGVRMATAAAGMRYKGRTDVLLVLLDPGTAVAGVLTQSKCPSAPVEWCRADLKRRTARALVVNSGNANAFTGKNGRQAAAFTAGLAAKAAGCKPAEVFLASTGVIGEPLDAAVFDGVLDELVAGARRRRLDRCRPRDHDHRHFPEGRDREDLDRQGDRHHQRHRQGRRHDRARHGDHAVVRVHRRRDRAGVLQTLLTEASVDTFNAVTVDGDTSTSDTLLAVRDRRCPTPACRRSPRRTIRV